MQKILKLYLLRKYSFSECAVILFQTLDVRFCPSLLRCLLCRFRCCILSCHVREKQNIIRLYTRLLLRLISLIGGSRRFPFNIRQLHGPLPVVDSKQIKIESLSFVGATQKPIFHEMHSRLTLASEIKKNNNNIWLSNQVQKFPKISASCVKRRGKFKHKEI